MDSSKLLPSELAFPTFSDSCLTSQLECVRAGCDLHLVLSFLALGAMEQQVEKLEIQDLGNIDLRSFRRLPWPS